MHDDDLKKLLRGAEADIGPTKVGPNAQCVRTAYRRRRQRGLLLTAAAPLALLAAIIAGRGLLSSNRPVEIVSNRPVPSLDEQLLSLEAEAELHAARARALMAERNAQLSLEADDPLAELRENVDIVAYRMILQADELQADMRPSRAAIEIYERVIQDFPNTYSAEVAQKRLSATSSEGVKS